MQDAARRHWDSRKTGSTVTLVREASLHPLRHWPRLQVSLLQMPIATKTSTWTSPTRSKSDGDGPQTPTSSILGVPKNASRASVGFVSPVQDLSTSTSP